LVGAEGEQQREGRSMTEMTELEAWKLLYAWARRVPATRSPQFKEARKVIRKSIKRVEKANDDPVALWKMVEEALAAQGYVLVYAISAEEVRSVVRKHTGCKELPAGFSDDEIVRVLRFHVRRYRECQHLMRGMNVITRGVALKLAHRAGLKWWSVSKPPDAE
jgi:hypothetical protein